MKKGCWQLLKAYLMKGAILVAAALLLLHGSGQTGAAQSPDIGNTAIIQPDVADIDCSDFESFCKMAILSSGQKYSNSYYLWIPQGVIAYYYVENTGGTWPVSIKVFKEGAGEVPNTTKTASYYVGANTGGEFVSDGANYFIQVISGDPTSPYTATGEGNIKYYRPM